MMSSSLANFSVIRQTVLSVFGIKGRKLRNEHLQVRRVRMYEVTRIKFFQCHLG
jgi:hypothetical protein